MKMTEVSEKTEGITQKVSSVDEFPVGSSKRVVVDGVPIAVWHLEDGFHAIEDSCPHAGASLAYGKLEKSCVVACPRHGSQFDIRSGRVLSLPSTRGLHTYPVEVREGAVYICSKPYKTDKPGLFRLP